MAAWQEWVAGTDPTNAASVLRVSTCAPTGTVGIALTWSVASGRWYRVEATNDLFAARPWPVVAGPWQPTNGQTWMQWSDTNGATEVNTFYRVDVQAP